MRQFFVASIKVLRMFSLDKLAKILSLLNSCLMFACPILNLMNTMSSLILRLFYLLLITLSNCLTTLPRSPFILKHSYSVSPLLLYLHAYDLFHFLFRKLYYSLPPSPLIAACLTLIPSNSFTQSHPFSLIFTHPTSVSLSLA